MERLTEKQSSGYDLKAMDGEWCNRYCEKQRVETCNECGIYQAIQKLAEYEDLEEKGLLLRLPCKVGDTVYIILASYFNIETYNIKYAKADVKDFAYFTSCGFCVVVTSKIFGKLTIPFSDFSKTVFLTQEETEQKLKEMESD